MDIRGLKYFISAAECLNFTRAAKECFITQTAMSQHIANMERELGWPVTVRHTGGTGGGGTVLTDGGKRLVNRYRRLQAEADRAVEELYRKYFGE